MLLPAPRWVPLPLVEVPSAPAPWVTSVVRGPRTSICPSRRKFRSGNAGLSNFGWTPSMSLITAYGRSAWDPRVAHLILAAADLDGSLKTGPPDSYSSPLHSYSTFVPQHPPTTHPLRP